MSWTVFCFCLFAELNYGKLLKDVKSCNFPHFKATILKIIEFNSEFI